MYMVNAITKSLIAHFYQGITMPNKENKKTKNETTTHKSQKEEKMVKKLKRKKKKKVKKKEKWKKKNYFAIIWYGYNLYVYSSH